MTGLELLKAPEATAGEIADIISAPCPPTIPAHCDGVSCRECWLTWLTGEPPEEKGPSDEQTAPCGGCPLQGKKRELIQLGRLLKEVGEYVNSSPSRTSQSRYANEGARTKIDELKKVKFSKRSNKAAQGDKSLTVDVDMMIVGGVYQDGVAPVYSTTSVSGSAMRSTPSSTSSRKR